MTPRERVIDLVTRLNAAREHLHGLEAELEQQLGPPSTETTPAPRTAARAARGGVSTRVVALLQSEPRTAFTVPEIANRLKIKNIAALRQAVTRLVALKRIERRSRGEYGALAKGGSETPSPGPAKREGWLSALFD